MRMAPTRTPQPPLWPQTPNQSWVQCQSNPPGTGFGDTVVSDPMDHLGSQGSRRVITTTHPHRIIRTSGTTRTTQHARPKTQSAPPFGPKTGPKRLCPRMTPEHLGKVHGASLGSLGPGSTRLAPLHARLLPCREPSGPVARRFDHKCACPRNRQSWTQKLRKIPEMFPDLLATQMGHM